MADEDLILRFQAQQAHVLAEVARIVRKLWESLPGYNRAEVAEFLAGIETVLPAAQGVMASSVDAMVSILTEEAPIGIPVFTDVRGIPLAEEFERPFIQIWKGLGEGKQWEDLVTQAGDRAVTMATMDTQVSMVRSMDLAAHESKRVVGYRRVLTGKSCMFCASASTRRYHRKNLMPLHAHCDCGVAPIVGDSDPGEVLNKELLSTLKGQGEQFWRQSGFVDAKGVPIDPTDLPKGLTRVVQHDELGPILQAA